MDKILKNEYSQSVLADNNIRPNDFMQSLLPYLSLPGGTGKSSDKTDNPQGGQQLPQSDLPPSSDIPAPSR